MKRGCRYAQEYGGQKLHLVEDFGHGKVAFRALCGRTPNRRGAWRMTINVSLGEACKKCLKMTGERPNLPVVIHA